LKRDFLISDLRRIIIFSSKGCRRAGVKIVTGDTKVVEKGKGDKIFINTAGVGSCLKDGLYHRTNAAPVIQL
jgi:hydrogenase expression/formation protein HypE